MQNSDLLKGFLLSLSFLSALIFSIPTETLASQNNRNIVHKTDKDVKKVTTKVDGTNDTKGKMKPQVMNITSKGQNNQNTSDYVHDNYMHDKYYVTLGYGYMLGSKNTKTGTIKDPDFFIDNLPLVYEKTSLKGRPFMRMAFGKEFEKIGRNFRYEFEFIRTGNRKVSLVDSYVNEITGDRFRYKYSVVSYAGLMNGYMDFKLNNSDKFIPYLGLGIGIGRSKVSKETIDSISEEGLIHTDATYPKNIKNSFAYQATLGTKFVVNEKIYLDLGYKFIDFGKVHGNTTQQLIGDDPRTVISPNANIEPFRNNAHVVMFSVGYRF